MLKPETLKFLQREAKNAGVTKMLLFGSCLYKPEDEANDIDIAVEGIDKYNLCHFVGNLLINKKPRKHIDIVDLSDNLPIVSMVLDEGMVIYERK